MACCTVGTDTTTAGIIMLCERLDSVDLKDALGCTEEGVLRLLGFLLNTERKKI